MLIEFSLGDSDGFLEVFVRQSRVQDGVTGFLQEGWFATADDAVPAVKEEDGHGGFASVAVSYENFSDGLQVFEASQVFCLIVHSQPGL